jgi:hypothetical protein
MPRSVTDRDGKRWDVYVGALSGDGSAKPGDNLMHSLDRTTLIFRSGDEMHFYSDRFSDDWTSQTDAEILRWLYAARSGRNQAESPER